MFFYDFNYVQTEIILYISVYRILFVLISFVLILWLKAQYIYNFLQGNSFLCWWGCMSPSPFRTPVCAPLLLQFYNLSTATSLKSVLLLSNWWEKSIKDMIKMLRCSWKLPSTVIIILCCTHSSISLLTSDRRSLSGPD